jgi:cytochrome c556
MSIFGFRLVAAALFLALAACSQSSSPLAAQSVSDAAKGGASSAGDTSQESPFEITATIRELMDSTVDPAADALWDSVAVTSTSKGVEETQPKTDADWAAVRRHAVTLMESMNLVVMKGRHAAPPGTKAAEGELSPAEIDQHIDANRGALIGFAKALRATAQTALTAIDKKDVQGLFKAGSDIDEACEACHVTFWYPNQKVPQA